MKTWAQDLDALSPKIRNEQPVSGDEPIRTLQFTCPSGFYGAERWILALASHLTDQNVVCDLAVTMEPGQGQLELVERYTAEMGRTFELPMKHRFDWTVVGKLRHLLQQEKYDIIHTHGYKSDILGVLAAKRAKAFSISTPHGFENAADWKLRTYMWLGGKAFRYFDRVAPLSSQLCDDVARLGVSADKLCYIQNGVDLSEVDAVRASRSDKSHTKSRQRIGFVGQLISRKNVKDLIDVFEMVALHRPNIELFILGDGEERVLLEEYASQTSCHDKIQFLGFRDDRLQLLKSFDLFAMTSSLEGIPRCLMEAMAMGVPVVAYDIAGVDQLIEHERTGLLAPLGDKETLANYWRDVLSNQDLATRLAKAAKETVESQFSAQRMADEYASLYAEMIQGS